MATNSKKVKRKPTPPSKASKGRNNASTSKSSANDKKNANTTVYNSSQDNALATKDAYTADFNNGTLNSLYKFANTLNLDLNKLSDKLRGGKDMLSKVNKYLKEANNIKNAIKQRNFEEVISKIAPGAKAALQNAGLSADKFDKIVEGAKLAIKVGNDVKKIKNGDLSILNGLNDLTRHITGYDLVNVQDILAVKEAATEVMKEFSNLGLEIGAEFKKLVRGENKGQSFDIATDVTTEIIHDLASNGDYNTMYHAIGLSDPQRMEQISGKVVEKMISEFSFNAVFNKEKDKNLIFEEMMKVIYSFRGGEALWIPRGEQRKIFNLKLFMNASSDFKTLIKVVLSNRFYLGPEDTKGKTGRGLIQYDQSDKINEVLMLLSNVFTKNSTNFNDEFSKDHGEFIIDGVARTDTLVSPSDFKANVLAL